MLRGLQRRITKAIDELDEMRLNEGMSVEFEALGEVIDHLDTARILLKSIDHRLPLVP